MSVPRVLHPFAVPARDAAAYLEIVRGEGCRIWDADGRSYLDATASLWYCAAGHGRQQIAAAITAQLAELEAYHTFARFTNRPEQELAEVLVALAPIPDARVLFTCGGSEAIDSALKLARAGHKAAGDSGRSVFLSRHYAYHGVMLGGTSAGGIPANRDPYGTLLSDFFQVERDSLEAMRAAVAYHGPERIAAIIAEPVIGAGGVYPPLPGYLEGLAVLCERTGALLVIDSVICGFGRLGTWYGIERWNVRPSMVVFAKGVTSGYLPLGGVLVADDVAEPFWRDPGGPVFRHGPTYAAHASCCAAGLANIGLLDREGLLERSRALEQPLLEALTPLEQREAVSEVRGGVGLLAAVELTDEVLERHPDAVARVVARARQHGVLVRALGRAVAVSPPLTVEVEHLGAIAEAIDQGVAALGTGAVAAG